MLVFYLAAIDNDESKNKFEYIYHKYYRFMLRTASSIIRDSSLAEDAVHETFVQLLKEIDSLRIDNEKSLQSYLYILTRERTIDFLRKWERRRGVLTDYENRSTSFDNFKEPEEIALTNLQLNKAVSILSDKVISIGAIFYLNGSNNRISIICGIQVPNDAIGVSRIIVQRVPSFTPLQNNSNIAIAAEIFQRPALIRIVCTAKKVNCFTVFYGTILVIAQNIHILTCCHILQLIVVVKFVCHL